MTAIICRGASHRYGTTPVLTEVDLDVPEASVTAIIGRSGSGKSTLLRLIAGFERLQGGEISIAGDVVSGPGRHLPTSKRRIGYVPQDAALFPHLTVARNIAFGLRGRRSARERVGELIDLVGLAGLAERYPHQLSGGQQQRVALARALAINPRALLLDEPFAALDANLRGTLRREVLAILRERNTTTVLVTHDQAEALSSADALGLLDAGVMRQIASPAELYTEPADRHVATFLGDANILVGDAAGDTVHTGLGALQPKLPASGPVEVLVRPEQIRLRRAEDAPESDWRIASAEYFGHDALYHVHHAAPANGCGALLVRCAADVALETGDSVHITVDGPVTTWIRRPGTAAHTNGTNGTNGKPS